MSENVIQTSFAAGELAPSIFARTDLAAYHQGLAVCRNMFVDYRSGVSTRQGTKYVFQCKSLGSKLVPFSVTTYVNYVVEMGDHYCRFYSNGAPVLESPFTISSITNANPAVANVPGHNFVVGDSLFLSNIVGMPQMNGRFVSVSGVSGNFVTLADLNGNLINSSAFGVYSSGGTASRIYTISSPYAAADLFPSIVTGNPGIKLAQSVSVLYITHPSYPPTTLSFAAPTNWFFSTLVFGTTIGSPTGLSLSVNIPVPATSGGTVATTYQYAVTAVDSLGQESLPTLTSQVTVSPAFGSGNIAVIAGTATISWAAVSGAVSYNIYKAQISYSGSIPSGAAFGFVGNSTGTSFIDSNISPDFTTSPSTQNNNPFLAGNDPGAVSFFQQRLYYGGSNSLPATFWASQPGAFQNFNLSNPIQASDTITGTIVANQLNQIKHMLPMPGGLIFLTGRSAYTLTTGQGANATLAVTPLNATLMPQAYNGSSDVTPIVVNEDILYVQAKGSIVRDLSYNIYAAIYTGTDISVRSNHLFFQHQILQWSYAEEPFKLVYAIRDDGTLLSLTFMKEQQISGWARHDTQGLFMSVSSIQESQVDAPYFIVQRTLPNGTVVQWIERMAERNLTYGAEDAWAVDAGIRSSLSTPNATILISGASGAVGITANASVFSSSSVGQVLRAGGGIITITGFVSPTAINGTVTQSITQLIQDFASGVGIPPPFIAGAWSIATPATKFFGLDYLAGQTVSINADGGVVTPQVVASDGSITLTSPATKVTAGLGFQCQGQTMPLDVGEPTIQGKRKKIAALNFKFANTRGIKAGRTLSTLMPLKDMNINVPIGSPIPLITGDDRIVMDPLWDVPGQLWFQVDDPLPATVLGVIPEVVVGDTK
jgi:hypothetical protein